MTFKTGKAKARCKLFFCFDPSCLSYPECKREYELQQKKLMWKQRTKKHRKGHGTKIRGR